MTDDQPAKPRGDEVSDSLDKLKQACIDGNVHLANEAPELANDGDTKLFAETMIDKGLNAVSIGLSDGGGFSSILLAKAQWPEIRARLDALFDLLEE